MKISSPTFIIRMSLEEEANSPSSLDLAEQLRQTALRNLGRGRQGYVSTITGKRIPEPAKAHQVDGD